MDLSNYDKVRSDAEIYYSKLRPILSPVFNELIYFPSESFNHIIYKNPRTEREKNSQMMRFKLIPKTLELIEVSTTYQEFEETIKTVTVKRRKHRVSVPKTVQYWGMIAIMRGTKIKVIIRRIGNGNLTFWSIIPDWVTNRIRDYKYSTTMKGTPEED